MKYSVTVRGHTEPITVEVAEKISFAAPVANLAGAQRAIAQGLVESIVAKLHDLPGGKELERDADGRIVRSFDRAPVSRATLAAEVAWQVAGEHLDGAVDK